MEKSRMQYPNLLRTVLNAAVPDGWMVFDLVRTLNDVCDAKQRRYRMETEGQDSK